MAARRFSVPVVVALLAAALVGPGVVGAVEPRTTRFITIPAAAFDPTNGSMDFSNDGRNLTLNSGSGYFVAPLFFETPAVTINSITLYAYDNSDWGDICVTLYRTTPWNTGEQDMGEVCSTGYSPTVPRMFTNSTTFTYRAVNGNYGPYLYLYLPGPYVGNYMFYGVRINYSY